MIGCLPTITIVVTFSFTLFVSPMLVQLSGAALLAGSLQHLCMFLVCLAHQLLMLTINKLMSSSIGLFLLVGGKDYKIVLAAKSACH
jgi:hypothetical protein